jgi:four helix bundle protein
MFNFQNLKVYKKSKSFHIACKKVIVDGKLEKYVIDQLGRASFSVPLNIAEGSGKFSNRDRRNFSRLPEPPFLNVMPFWTYYNDEGKISESDLKKIMTQADELSRILYSMIKNLS